jgi:hypothetical protein
MKSLIIVFCFFLIASSAVAQVDVPTQERSKELGETVFGLGVSAGFLSGFGLSFRYHTSTAFSYQVVGGIIKADSRLSYDLGGLLQYNLVRGEKIRFYACGGAGYFYSGENENELEGPFRSGVGIGIEQARVEAFNFSAEFVFTFFSDGTVIPLPQVGAHYYFF